jgi:sugar lactone lactonase YvrE
MHPASDPSVTGVGATTLILNLSTGLESSETGFSLEQVMGGESASGGGISALFSRPSWQTGTGVPSGMMRLVPDLAATGDPADGCYIFYDGSGATPYGGTSVSAPIWSGFCALLNQALANASLPPVGLLGPKIYPLIGTTSLRDITSGNNGLYSAGVGYDMVTGVGVPNVGALALSLGAQGSAPQITAQPASMTAMPGQNASFSVTASGFPSAAYQWQVQATGTTTWSNLSDNGTYSGSATATLTVSSATTALSGNLYQCVVSNSLGTVTSAPAALVVVYPLSLTTLAGLAGTSGSADGTGSAARFYDPCDVAADSAGNVFVADTNNSTIRKITPAGAVTTLAGLAGTSGSSDGTGSAARFNSPAGLAVDGSDNVYVADTHNNTIRKISPTGVVTTVAGLAGSGGSSDGTGTARFNSPAGLTVDGSGNVYVADTHNNTIRKITPTGVVSTVAGLAGTGGSSNGTGSAALFSSPEGVTVDGSGNLYVADTGNHTIRKITPAGAVTTLAGLAGISGSSDGAGSMARFQYPAGLTVTSAGNLYVADTDNNTIRQISPAGLVATIAGLAGFSGSTDGVGSAARLFYPDGVAVDGSGNVYVADTDNHTIREGQVVSAPQILTQPQSETVTVGTNVTFSVTATGVPAPTYQWNNSGAAISGATASTLTLNNVQTGSAGTYTVVVTNLLGSVTSNPATLTVNAAAATTSTPSSGGGGGGGGAPSLWFYGAFSLLVALRRAFRRK